MSLKTRTQQVEALRALAAGRGREVPVFESRRAREEAAGVTEAPMAPVNAVLRFTAIPQIGSEEPFTQTRDVLGLLGELRSEYNRGLRYSPEWQHMLSATPDGRADARRLEAALESVRDEGLFAVGQPTTVALALELARATTAVQDRLLAEGERTLHGRVANMGLLATQLAERTVATVLLPDTWQTVFKTTVADGSPLSDYQRVRAIAKLHWWTVTGSGFETIEGSRAAQGFMNVQRIMLNELPETVDSFQEAARRLDTLLAAVSSLHQVLRDLPAHSHPDVEAALGEMSTQARLAIDSLRTASPATRKAKPDDAITATERQAPGAPQEQGRGPNDDVQDAGVDSQGRPRTYERVPLAGGGWEIFPSRPPEDPRCARSHRRPTGSEPSTAAWKEGGLRGRRR